MKRKPKLNLVRKVLFWVLYDPARKEIVEMHQYKYQLPIPSRESGRVIFQCQGFYPSQVGKSEKP